MQVVGQLGGAGAANLGNRRHRLGAAVRRCGIVARPGGPDLATKLSWGFPAP